MQMPKREDGKRITADMRAMHESIYYQRKYHDSVLDDAPFFRRVRALTPPQHNGEPFRYFSAALVVLKVGFRLHI